MEYIIFLIPLNISLFVFGLYVCDNIYKKSKNMKIIEDHYNDHKINCPYCDSVLKVEKNDIMTDEKGEKYIKCPLCNLEWELTMKHLIKLNSIISRN